MIIIPAPPLPTHHMAIMFINKQTICYVYTFKHVLIMPGKKWATDQCTGNPVK